MFWRLAANLGCGAAQRRARPTSAFGAAEEYAKAAAGLKLRRPVRRRYELGPLVSAALRERVLDNIRTGGAEDATLVTGRRRRSGGSTTGHFVRPTVLAEVTRPVTVACEEIFGPVLCLLAGDG